MNISIVINIVKLRPTMGIGGETKAHFFIHHLLSIKMNSVTITLKLRLIVDRREL
jgi:hypothetical protein